ncbi:AraC family transcriptional regulator [Persicitalea jodogahamensis]|uniref:AraC family transcriptional regulator n=1 Tax=Persicitalea jodogahamensis TaxID=402147 RepID=A0A8J3D1E9_9BACT|nr:AraC family transcriptional regulator [Persicitalea jodogahamensis]GHB63552.1 AraC family transcriptional regulator [Persicitalea jodogahamensis]
MKAVFEEVLSKRGESVLCKKVSLPSFDAPFHFHPEYELTWIRKGEGLRYVGMNAGAFGAGDLVLLGSNLPHCWVNQPEEDGSNVEACVVQFDTRLLNDSLLQWPEFQPVARLLDYSTGGISFDNHTIGPLFERLVEVAGPKRIICFLDLLLQLAETPRHIIIETGDLYADQQRFKVIFSYLIEHFREPIELEKVSGLAGLTPTSFCRYFKKITGKTLFDVVLNYRLEAAAQLLLRTEKPVNDIAFMSGFENLPYFSRTFKKWKGLSPRAFRHQYRA